MARIYQQNLTQDQWDQVLAQKDSMHLDDYLGLTTESNDIFDRIMDCGDNQLDILDFIDGQKAQLSKTKRQHDQCYQMLLIVEQV
jgi:succinate dehydrogenase flavin-adding protein (antitoxin of CptAB toxin-antitoxin module)